jgi:ribokinase
LSKVDDRHDRVEKSSCRQEVVMRNVWIAGSVNVDIVATAARHPKIGETVAGKEVFFFPGGKGANQAVAAAKLGAPTALIGKVGNGGFGRELRHFLSAQNVGLEFLRDTPDIRTGTAVITVADADNAIVVIPGANALVSERDVAEPPLAESDVAVSQFEIPIPTVSAFFSRARSAGATTILNPAPALAFERGLLDLVDILILNETELGMIAGAGIGEHDSDARIVEVARSLQTRDRQSIVVTLGGRGAVAWTQGRALVIPGRSVQPVDTTGAGDCFVGAVAAQIALGVPIAKALDYANVAASICVQRMGAGPSMPTKAEVATSLGLQRN